MEGKQVAKKLGIVYNTLVYQIKKGNIKAKAIKRGITQIIYEVDDEEVERLLKQFEEDKKTAMAATTAAKH